MQKSMMWTKTSVSTETRRWCTIRRPSHHRRVASRRNGEGVHQRQCGLCVSANAKEGNGYTGAAFTIKTFNAISKKGLLRFPDGRYEISGDSEDLSSEAMAIMLRR